MNACYRAWGKRILDVALALVGAGVAIPVAAVLCRLVTWTSPGPVILCQLRLGQHGRPFLMVKFRSMTLDGARVTPFGWWLRATALDELPQVINILQGSMSFVGPRPLLEGDVDLLRMIPEAQRRASIIPGLAGLAQLYGGKHPTPADRLALDLWYTRHVGFWLDGWIVCRAMLTSLGARWEPPMVPCHRA